MIQWFYLFCISPLDSKNIFVLEMTSINRPTILPKKLDFTPNCAILSKMDLKKLHNKISSNISSQNCAQTGHFSHEIKNLLQQDLKIKRSKLDKMSSRQKKEDQKSSRPLPIINKIKKAMDRFSRMFCH